MCIHIYINIYREGNNNYEPLKVKQSKQKNRLHGNIKSPLYNADDCRY